MTTRGLCRYCDTEQPLTRFAVVDQHKRNRGRGMEFCSGAFLPPREVPAEASAQHAVTCPDVFQAA